MRSFDLRLPPAQQCAGEPDTNRNYERGPKSSTVTLGRSHVLGMTTSPARNAEEETPALSSRTAAPDVLEQATRRLIRMG